MSEIDVAWLDRGRLFVRTDASEPRVVESRFGESMRDRLVQIEQRSAWKTQGRGAQFMRGGMLWGVTGRDGESVPISITGVSRGTQPGEILYALKADEVHGLFAWTAADDGERRLFHGTKFQFHDVSADFGHPRVACTIRYGMTSNLAVLNADGSQVTEVTEGDSNDMFPSWVPGSEDELIYQSAGVARDGEGVPLCLGPSAIHRLNIRTGQITPVLEDAKFDFLCPRMHPGGELFFIRRPYRVPDQGRPWAGILDVILIPWRLLEAIFGFLDLFSKKYAGKPLTRAGGPESKDDPDARQLVIMGNLIDAQKAERESRKRGDLVAGIVPSSWQLMRRSASGTDEVLEKGVVAYDFGPDDTIVYSNGRAVFQCLTDGTRQKLGEGRQIFQVAVFG